MTKNSGKIEFSAVIKSAHGGGAYVEFPYDLFELFGTKRAKVKATFDSVPYRGSVVRMGGQYLIGILKEIRQKINKQPGDNVKVIIELDNDPR